MEIIHLIAWAAAVLAAGGALSFAVMSCCAYGIYKGFDSEEKAIAYYRGSCGHSMSHRIMRTILLIAAAAFIVYVVFSVPRLNYDKARLLCCSASLLTVAVLDVYFGSGIGGLMARARICSYIRTKYNIPDGIVEDWFVDLDDDDFPEELELDLDDGGKLRTFLVDLVHGSVIETAYYDE